MSVKVDDYFKRHSTTFEIPNRVSKGYEIQLRMGLFDSKEEQTGCLPKDVKITLNGRPVELPVSICKL
jgi:hypothetical protein